MDFVYPSLLKPGDKIAIVAPSRKIDPRLVEQTIDIVQDWGLQVVPSKNLLSSTHTYFSGNDEQRLKDLQAALDDKDIRAILCARGGYGASRIVDELDFYGFRSSPKWLIGFSDITSLHLRLLHEGFASIHGTMPVLFPRADSAVSVESLRKVLFQGSANIHAAPSSFNRAGEASGVVVGGNLSLLADSLGTKTEMNSHDCILFIEEIDEYFYKVDRMLTQLKRAGKLTSIKGLVVGHMTDIKNGELIFAERFEQVILDAIGNKPIPVAFGMPSGHENPNLAWIEGGKATLTVSDKGSQLCFRAITSGI